MKNLRIQDDNKAEKVTRWKTFLRKYEERNLLLKKQEEALRLQFLLEENSSDQHLAHVNLLPTKDENINCHQVNQNPLHILGTTVSSLPLISANFQSTRKRLNITDKKLYDSTDTEDCLIFQKPKKNRNDKARHKCAKSDHKIALSKCELAQCKERHAKSEKYIDQLNNLRFQLATAIQNVRGLDSVNGQLRKEMCLLKDKTNSVTKTFIDQKINETHAIAKLKEKLLKNKKHFDDNASLCMLARRVSETLMEMANFTEVDLTEVQKRIENIREEEETKPSKKGNVCICSDCCTCEEDIKKAKLRAERIKQILSEKRDACTGKTSHLERESVRVIRGIEIVCDSIGEGGEMFLDKQKGIELADQLESGVIIELLGEFDEVGEETGECGVDEFEISTAGELAELEEAVRYIIHEDLLEFPSGDKFPDRESVESYGGPLAVDEISEAERILGYETYAEDSPGYARGGPDYKEGIPGAEYSEGAPDYTAEGSGYSEDAPGGYTAEGLGYSEDAPGYTAAGPGYFEDAPSYIPEGSEYSRNAPDYTDSDYAEGAVAGPGVISYDDSGASYDKGASDYSDRGPDYLEGAPGYTGEGPDSNEHVGASREFADGAPDFTSAVVHEGSPDATTHYGEGVGAGPSDDGSGYAVPGASDFTREGLGYSESGPGYTDAGLEGSGPGYAGVEASGYSESGPGYTDAGAPGYPESGPGFTGAGALGYSESGVGRTDAGAPGFSEIGPGYTGAGAPGHPESGPGYTGAGAPGYPESGPGYTGAGASGYPESGPGYTGAGAPGYPESGPGYTGAGASGYPESGPGYSGAGAPGYSESGPGHTGVEPRDYYESGPDSREGVGVGKEFEDGTSGAGLLVSEGAEGYDSLGAKGALAPDGVGERYTESAPSYTSGGPAFIEDGSFTESDAIYDKSKPSYIEDEREISEIGENIYDERNLSEAESSLYEGQISTAEGEPDDSTTKTDALEAKGFLSESGGSISTKPPEYAEEGRYVGEEHPPGCECVDCICSEVIKEGDLQSSEKMTKGTLETIDEERPEEQRPVGGEKFVLEDDQDKVKLGAAGLKDSDYERLCREEDSKLFLDKTTCTEADLLSFLLSTEPRSCDTQETRDQVQVESRSAALLPETCVESSPEFLPSLVPHAIAHEEGVIYEPEGAGTDDYSITTAIADSGTIQIITEGPEGVIETSMTYTPSGNIDVKTEITEYECPVRDQCLTQVRESEIYADITEPFVRGGPEEADDIARDVADALNRANQEVMDALSRANQNVTDAMEKANRDVENALAMVMSIKSSSPVGSFQGIKTSEKSIQEEDEGETGREFEYGKGSKASEDRESRKGDEAEWAYGEEKPDTGREGYPDRLDEYGESSSKREGERQWTDGEERPIRDAEKGESRWEDSERKARESEEGWKGGDEKSYADGERGGESREGGEAKPDGGREKRDGEWEDDRRDGGRGKYDDEWDGGEKKTDGRREGYDDKWEDGERRPERGREGYDDERENDRRKSDERRGNEREREGYDDEWESGERKPERGREGFDDEWEGGERRPERGREGYDDEWEGGERRPERGREGYDDEWEDDRRGIEREREGYDNEREGGERRPDGERDAYDGGDEKGSRWGGEATEGEWEDEEEKPGKERDYEEHEGGKGGEVEWDDSDIKSDREREEMEKYPMGRTSEDEILTKAWRDEGGGDEDEARDGIEKGGERYIDESEEEALSTVSDAPRHQADETGECTCEECLNKEGGGDCTCTAECKCPICTDLKIIAKSSRISASHPPGCTCIDCLCKENFPNEGLGVQHKHPPDCDCIACICGPGDPDKTKKQCHPPDCECLQCICSPPAAAKELICTISVKFSEHPEGCDCIDCICSKGIEGVEERGVGDTCKYVDEKEKKVEIQIVKSAGDFATETPCDHKPGCDCLECICETFESRLAKIPEKSKSKPSVPLIHGFNCDCLECLCDFNEASSSCQSEGSHLENCNCVHCLCGGEREITAEDIEEAIENADEIVTNIKVRSQCPYPGHPAGCTCAENYMKRSSGYAINPSECPCSKENLEPEILTLKMPTAEIMEVTDVKRISSDSLLIKWTECAVQETTGYEIFVNGVSKSRVYTKFRTAAILTSLKFDSDLDINVYAIYYGSHLQPPARALFEVNCDLNAKTKKHCII